MLLESLEVGFEREQRLLGKGGISARRSQARYAALLSVTVRCASSTRQLALLRRSLSGDIADIEPVAWRRTALTNGTRLAPQQRHLRAGLG